MDKEKSAGAGGVLVNVEAFGIRTQKVANATRDVVELGVYIVFGPFHGRQADTRPKVGQHGEDPVWPH